jgi:hypothetical protein
VYDLRIFDCDICCAENKLAGMLTKTLTGPSKQQCEDTFFMPVWQYAREGTGEYDTSGKSDDDFPEAFFQDALMTGPDTEPTGFMCV